MPIIGNVGRRSFRVRFLNFSIHFALLLGCMTMIYPLMIMLSGSVKSAVDTRKLTIFPEYFYQEDMHYRKWVEAKYNETLSEHALSYREKVFGFEVVDPPERAVERRYADWREFEALNEHRLDEFHYSIGHAFGIGVRPELTRRFVEELKREVGRDVEGVNRRYQAFFAEWDAIIIPALNLVRRSTPGDFTPIRQRMIEFGQRQDPSYRNYYSLDSFFTEQTLRPQYGQRIAQLNQALGTDYRSWSEVTLARTVPDGPLRDDWVFFVKERLNLQYIEVSEEARTAWQEFLRDKYRRVELVNDRHGPDFMAWIDIPAADARRYLADAFGTVEALNAAKGTDYALFRDVPHYYATQYLREKFGTIDALNQAYKPTYASFGEIPLVREVPRQGVLFADWDFFVTQTAKPEHLTIRSLEFDYRDHLQEKYGTIERVAEAHEFGVRDFAEVPLLERLTDENVAYAADWTAFLETIRGKGWVAPHAAASDAFREFLTAPYTRDGEVDLDALNEALGTNYAAVERIYVPTAKPANPRLAERWVAFVEEEAPKNLLVVDTEQAEGAWRDFLRGQYGDAATINEAYAYVPATFDKVNLPVEDMDYFYFRENKRASFWEFFVRNYAVVFEVMLYSGNAIVNTVIYCLMAIIGALIVNPMGAYALSRYKPPSQYKLLLFLMLTMAFPAMVLQIPTFLLIRNLGLLNTFWALVLPGVANGYSIFLLKGFFDSLPRELYESASLDGASEWTMFWQITMATSKPILAVIALQSFQLAYANFMMAFILCQDPRMWTLMVHLYQLQQTASQGVVFASLVIAAIPTLTVFIFCQNLIMRGIVVPTEK